MIDFSRRRFLAVGALVAAAAGGTAGVAALVDNGVLPGGGRLAQAMGRCGDMPTPPNVEPGPVQEQFVPTGGGPVRALIGWPPGAKPGTALPVTVLLHGGGGNARTPFDVYAIQRYLADAVRQGATPFAVASVDLWFRDGVVDGLLAFLAEQHLRTERFGLLGWSMGGDGVLKLASGLGGGRVAAVVATSPAINDEAAERYARGLTGIPVWAGCGDHDSFAGPTKKLLATLRDKGGRADGGIYSGCHDSVFRRKMLPRQLAFLGEHLR